MLPTRPARTPPLKRPLLWLALAVLLAHLALLAIWSGGADTTLMPPGSAPAMFHVRATASAQPDNPSAATPTTAPEPPVLAPERKPVAMPRVKTTANPDASTTPARHASAASDTEQNSASALLHTGESAIQTIAFLPSRPLPEAAPDADTEAAPHADVLAQARPASTASTVKVKIPGPVLLNYQVTGQARGIGYNATATLRWLPSGDSYQARLEIRTMLGKRAQSSDGQIGPQGLAPTRFSDKTRSEQAAHFVRDQGKIVFSGNAPEAALQPGAQDRLSVVLQLAAMLAGEPDRYKPGSTVAIQTAGTRDAEIWRFEAAGTETLQLPGGSLPTWKFVRQPREKYDQRVELWFAPERDFLPVRIKLTQVSGDFVDQQWQGSEKP